MAGRVISAILAGLIAALGALMALVVELPNGSELGDISSITWLVIVVTGVLTAAKDLQAYLKDPGG